MKRKRGTDAPKDETAAGDKAKGKDLASKPVRSSDPTEPESNPHTFLSGSPYFLAVVLVCAIGIGIAVELTRVYVLSHSDPTYESFCAMSEGVNCEKVATSSYASVFGVVNSVWAIFAYAWLMFMSLWGMRERRRNSRHSWPQGVMMAVSSVLLIVSIALVYVMEFLVGSLCILCLGLDVVNLALFVLIFARWRATSRTVSPFSLLLADIKWVFARPAALAAAVVTTAALLFAAVSYSHEVDSKIAAANQARERLTIGPDSFLMVPAASAQPHQCSGDDCAQCQQYRSQSNHPTVHMGKSDGNHWIGAAEPKITIEEFTDYECPFCRRAHLQLRAAMARNPTALRVVHRNYPLDRSCNKNMQSDLHMRACMLSRVAICAGEQGRFWEMNDFLFLYAENIRSKEVSADELAQKLELDLDRFQCCMSSEETTMHLDRDLKAGYALGLEGTPAYVIDGEIHYGKPPESVQNLLSAEGS